MSFYYKPYVSVAMRREKASKKMAKLKKQGVDIQPVAIQGRKISKTFWGNAWCDHIEQFSDIDNRLPRGRTYVRNGSVCHLNIEPGMVYAKVMGSELYNIEIQVDKLKKKKWQDFKKACSGKVGSILELLQGSLSSSVMKIVTEPDNGIMPGLGEMEFECDCPDWADMCKHVAAVLYGIGARLDVKPELLFELREVDPAELVETVDVPFVDTSSELDDDLSSLFGVEIDQKNTPATTKKRKTKAKIKPFKPTKTAIKLLRKRLDLNKSQFAKLVSVSPSTVSSWENKPGRITLKPSSEKALKRISNLTKKQAWKRVGIK